MSTTELEHTVETAVAAVGLELVNCTLSSLGRKKLLRVFIDSPSGVTIDDCQQASRQIQSALDVSLPLLGDYNLEVSSPGMDRALVKPEHYKRYVNSRIKVKLRQDKDGRRNFTGELTAVTDDLIQLLVDGKTFELTIADIEKANVVPDF